MIGGLHSRGSPCALPSEETEKVSDCSVRAPRGRLLVHSQAQFDLYLTQALAVAHPHISFLGGAVVYTEYSTTVHKWDSLYHLIYRMQ